MRSRIAAVLELMRVHQWVKNLLVFVAPLAGHEVVSAGNLRTLVELFLAFSLVASSTYILNDLMDLETDREHPRKRKRPLASGRLPRSVAWASPVLAAVGFWLAFNISVTVGVLLIVYAVMTTLYSMWLKTQPLVDVGLLSGLYTIRVVAGQIAVSLGSSLWLLGFCGFLFLSLAILKRVSEYDAMIRAGDRYDTRRGYQPSDIAVLQVFGIASTFSAVIILGLYVGAPPAGQEYATPELLWIAVPLVLFWLARMWLSAARGYMTDDPIVYAARDWVSRLCLALLVMVYLAASTIGG